jgi:5-methylcytosine-specific restriction endonuclease McrA
MSGRDPSQEFTEGTIQLAKVRQKNCCGSCGRDLLTSGEGMQAHHIIHVKFGGSNLVDNCVVLCKACHYSVHEGGNYRYGTVIGRETDFPFFRASLKPVSSGKTTCALRGRAPWRVRGNS